MQTKSVLVAGATGFLGTEICRRLAQNQTTVKALVRKDSDESKVRQLQNTGVEIIYGDLKDPASLAAAVSGIDTVISTASSTLSRRAGDSIDSVDREGQINLVEAAAAGQVNHFIYISFTESPFPSPLQDAKRAVEEKLKTSRLDYTILRPTFFMEVWLSPNLGFDPVNHTATIYGHGANKLSFISIKDVASFAVAAIENNAALNRTIDLGGPEALSPLEVVSIFEDGAAQKFEIKHIPDEALKHQYEMAADPLQKSFAALMLTYAAGGEITMAETSRAFGVRLTSVKDYSKQFQGMSHHEKEPA